MVNVGISEETKKRQKYTRTWAINDTAVNDFREALSAIDISSLSNASLSTEPNIDYEKFENIITEIRDKYFPAKCVKFDQYKHKLSNWITHQECSNRSNSEANYINALKCILL